MAFEFIETTTIELPDIKENILEYTESATSTTRKLIVEQAAIHEGLTANYNNYSAKELEAALSSWVSPYPKPIIINHDVNEQPLGRVMAARMDKEADGTPFTRLQMAITDPAAIQRILDQRYITGSVGGSAKSASCSICGVDWAEAKGPGAPCKHQRGKVYGGKLAYFELGGLSFREYSFVNVPADQRSSILPTSQDEDGWVRSTKIFSLDMNNESIVEFDESRGPINILEGMRKKEAHFVYTNLKGTWLSTSAYAEFENDKNIENITNDVKNTTMSNEASGEADVNVIDEIAEEKEMPEAIEDGAEELDITTVMEQLSDDLAASSEVEEESSESSDVVESEEVNENPEKVEEEASEEAESTEDVDATEANEEDDQSSEVIDEGDSDSDVEEGQQVDEEVIAENEQLAEETETEESAESDEVTELRAQYEKVVNENKQLKKMMHKVLAERVVDKKIDLGIVQLSERAEALEEHGARSAASLADTLKDLHQFRPLPSLQNESISELAKATFKAVAVGSDGVVEDVTENKDPVKTVEEKAVDLFTDVLMGRRPAL